MSIYANEAFVYLWFNSTENMFYLGYHKGSPEDGYSHSSKILEQFDANNPPIGWRRRILAVGTQSEMRQLEYELLKTRKKKWNKYYNIAAGWSFPISQHLRDTISVSNSKREWSEFSRKKLSESIKGENHPLYGKKHSEEARQKMSQAKVGKKLTEEHKAKINPTGRKHSQETKDKIAEANRKRVWSDASREKLSKSKKKI